MKTLSFILALASVPSLVAHAADAGALEGYLPTDGSYKPGIIVRPEFNEDFISKLNAALQKAAPEAREAYAKQLVWANAPAYSADIFPNREDYDAVVKAWRATPIQPIAVAMAGFQEVSNGIWRIPSIMQSPGTKQSQPLSISALRYDANRNVWISGNGELQAKEFTATEEGYLYGAQTGTEWVLEKKSSLTQFRECLRLTKTTDGKYVYLSYEFREVSSITGASIATGSYMIQFPVPATGAKVGTPGQR